MPNPRPGPPFTPGTDKQGRVSRYRVELPHAGIVETEHGRFEATEYAERRSGWKGRYLGVRDRVLGTTLSNARLAGERLSKIKALAVFSSDAISSVAYAPQEILLVLLLAGSGAMKWSLPIAVAITLLLAIVVASYRQTVRAYPNGGGSYIVAHENLGIGAGLIAAASLLVDYVLTVSVSVAAGIDALSSLNEEFRVFALPLAVVIVCFVALINLRGVSESGTFFSIPTYAFIFLLTGAIVATRGDGDGADAGSAPLVRKGAREPEPQAAAEAARPPAAGAGGRPPIPEGIHREAPPRPAPGLRRGRFIHCQRSKATCSQRPSGTTAATAARGERGAIGN